MIAFVSLLILAICAFSLFIFLSLARVNRFHWYFIFIKEPAFCVNEYFIASAFNFINYYSYFYHILWWLVVLTFFVSGQWGHCYPGCGLGCPPGPWQAWSWGRWVIPAQGLGQCMGSVDTATGTVCWARWRPQQTGLQMPWRESGSGSLPWISRGPPPPRPLARESGLSCFCLLICPHPLVTMGCRPHQPPHQHENNGQGTQSSAAPQCPGCCWSTFAQPFRILLWLPGDIPRVLGSV